MSVEDLVTAHWKEFGRNFFSRYDYEEVNSAAAQSLMDDLILKIEQGTIAQAISDASDGVYSLAEASEFSYTDPIDGSVSNHQGIRIVLTDSSRIVFRLSGTGSVGATVRLYLEQYSNENVTADTQEALGGVLKLALAISGLTERLGRNEPTVIT